MMAETMFDVAARSSLAKKTSAEYASYFEVENLEQFQGDVKELQDTMEGLLARFDESEGVSMKVKSDSDEVFQEHLPGLLKTCEELEPVFEQIEDIEVGMLHHIVIHYFQIRFNCIFF